MELQDACIPSEHISTQNGAHHSISEDSSSLLCRIQVTALSGFTAPHLMYGILQQQTIAQPQNTHTSTSQHHHAEQQNICECTNTHIWPSDLRSGILTHASIRARDLWRRFQVMRSRPILPYQTARSSGVCPTSGCIFYSALPHRPGQ